jgi:hypothetical protein
MSKPEVLANTKGAAFALLSPGILQQRFLPADLAPEDLEEMARMRERLFQTHGPCGLMLILPADVALRPDLMGTDHYRGQREKRQILALAIVADGEMLHAACRVYFIYHPQPFPAEVFEEDHDALRWLELQMDAIKDGQHTT